MTDEQDQPTHDPSHWAHYTTDALEQLLESLEGMERGPQLTIAAVKAELERRRSA